VTIASAPSRRIARAVRMSASAADGVDGVQAGDVEDRRRRAVLDDAGQQGLHHLLGALRVEGADQRQHDHAVGDRQQRRRDPQHHLAAARPQRLFGELLLGDVVKDPDHADHARRRRRRPAPWSPRSMGPSVRVLRGPDVGGRDLRLASLRVVGDEGSACSRFHGIS
jgi:hypothetical protein